jgi:uncharacterized membrane protein YhaH (DUF805 family)
MGIFSVSPFGRLSLAGFWANLGLIALLGLIGFAVDMHAIRPMGLAPYWPPQTFAPQLTALLSVLPGPATAAALALGAWSFLMAMVRRLHDRGFGGWALVWMLAAMAVLGWTAWRIEAYWPSAPLGSFSNGAIASAIAGVVFLLLLARLMIICLFLRGQDDANRFGAKPGRA